MRPGGGEREEKEKRTDECDGKRTRIKEGSWADSERRGRGRGGRVDMTVIITLTGKQVVIMIMSSANNNIPTED